MSDTIVKSAAEMMELGKEYAAKAKSGDVFGLVGTLGTGKTHWTKGFMEGIDPQAAVSSPTFSIVNEYRGDRHTVFHFDFYRLKTADELIGLGWDEYIEDDAITICEWADLFPELMPDHTVWLEISHLPDGSRRISPVSRKSK